MTHPTEQEIYNQEVNRENQVMRENNAASSGLTLGILLASIVALGVGAFFFINQQNDNPAPKQTTIIEKTKEVPQPRTPDVNINVPSPPPVEAPDVDVKLPSPMPQNNSPAASPAPDQSRN